jgi:hypothetical protein
MHEFNNVELRWQVFTFIYIYSITHGTLAAILSNRWSTCSILVSLPTNKQVQREKLDEWLEKQKSIGSFVLAIPIVPLVNISSMPYLESEQQDETRNVTEYDSEKAAVFVLSFVVFIFLCCPIRAICQLDYPFRLTFRSFLASDLNLLGFF